MKYAGGGGKKLRAVRVLGIKIEWNCQLLSDITGRFYYVCVVRVVAKKKRAK